jgi:hypothetical protein
MSVIRCQRCEQSIDSDYDCECYVELPSYANQAHPLNPAPGEREEFVVLCESCRDDDHRFC